MIFDSIRVVLVSTSHPGNIGSTARAMKTMGLTRLYLVNPRIFPEIRASEMAAGANDILEQAVVTDSLTEALDGCHLVIGTSARAREIGLPGLKPDDCAKLIAEKSNDTGVALVFGREHAGLTNDEILHCHYHLNIPSNPDFSSLNLSQAVQIVAYEIRMKLLEPQISVETRFDQKARAEDIEYFYQHLQLVLTEIGFLKSSNPKRLFQKIRRLFNRIQLEKMEVGILRGILSEIQQAINK